MNAIAVNIIAGFISFAVTFKAVPTFMESFSKANLFGYDMSKREKKKVPEAMGVICGAVYLIVMFLYIPFPFVNVKKDAAEVDFNHRY